MKLETYLLQQGVLDVEALAKLHQQSERLVMQLVRKPPVSLDRVTEIIAHYFDLSVVDVRAFSMDEALVRQVPEWVLWDHVVVPLNNQANCLTVAMVDPGDLQAIDLLQFYTGKMVHVQLGHYDDIMQWLQQFKTRSHTLSLSGLAQEDMLSNDIQSFHFDGQDDEPLIRFVNTMIHDAVQKDASDIHFEVFEQTCRVRFRQDGLLYEIARPPKSIALRLAARLKIMARLDIAEHRMPQDGRCKVTLSSKREIDLRVNSCPTLYGEKVVLRLLDSGQASRDVDALNFNPQQYCSFQAAVSRPQGLILVSGPTGSGKTVTLYAALKALNQPTRNISTVEDPVEINLPGINQVNVHPKSNLTFACCLRAFLRQDPDVIMVGEIRDLETAEIAIKAAQTGHLVLSTLHTNSAIESLIRLRNMGVMSYQMASSLVLITAQRLVRRLCPHCKEAFLVHTALAQQYGWLQGTLNDDALIGKQIFKAKGCKFCTQGYRGRVAVHEVLPIDEDFVEKILAKENIRAYEQLCHEKGILRLQQAGLQNVLAGETDLAEIDRVIGLGLS